MLMVFDRNKNRIIMENNNGKTELIYICTHDKLSYMSKKKIK